MSENDEKFDRAQKALEGLSDQFYEGDLEGLFDSGEQRSWAESDAALRCAVPAGSALRRARADRAGRHEGSVCAYDVRATREVAWQATCLTDEDVYDAFLREGSHHGPPGTSRDHQPLRHGDRSDGRPFFTMELKRGRDPCRRF